MNAPANNGLHADSALALRRHDVSYLRGAGEAER